MSTETVSLKKAKATAQGANGQAKKAKKAKKSKTDAKNREAIKGSIRKEKDLMYKYIDKEGNHVADEDKKAYRAAARKRFDSYAKKLKKEKDPEARAKLLKKANAFIHKTYNVGIKPEFV